MSNQQPKLVSFLDTIGRTILGELKSSTDTSLEVTNPVILNVVPSQDGKMSVQLFPLFFREFLADKADDVVFTYNKNGITLSNIEALDFRLAGQYGQMFNKNNLFVPAGTLEEAKASAAKHNVVNLFEE